jgi:hypothetical protein
MMSCSTAIPTAATANAARTAAKRSGRPTRLTSVTVKTAPNMIKEAWAKLITFITPKMTARPIVASARKLKLVRNW